MRRIKISVLLAAYLSIWRMNSVTRTLLLEKEIFYRTQYLEVVFHLNHNWNISQISKAPSSKVRKNLIKLPDKDRKRISKNKTIDNLHPIEAGSIIATMIGITKKISIFMDKIPD